MGASNSFRAEASASQQCVRVCLPARLSARIAVQVLKSSRTLQDSSVPLPPSPYPRGGRCADTYTALRAGKPAIPANLTPLLP